MAELTTEETFSVGADGVLITDSVTLTVTGPPTYPGGLGRLTHPTLGVFDYSIAPDEWVNIDTDIIVAPIWSHARSLSGAQATRWDGSIQDVEAQERWSGAVAMKMSQLRMLVDIWRTPPTAPEYVVWTPNYLNPYSYNVHVVDISAGGSGITSSYLSLQGDGFAKGPITVTYRIVEKL